MPATAETNIAVVGPDCRENLRLAEELRGIVGNERVLRFLETQHLLNFLAQHADRPTAVFLDLFGYDLTPITATIGEIRNRFPKVVFGLYLDRETWITRRSQLPGGWAARLVHYYSLHKVPDDEEFEPIVRQALRDVDWEAQYNFGHEPIRLTEPFDAGVVEPDSSHAARPLGDKTVFVSYSRADWDDPVSHLIEELRQGGFQLWVDQGFLEGGEDWMDAIGLALKECSVCLLAVSPDALSSRWVKMEYRFFVLNEKPIVPVMIKPAPELPFELTGIQYVDLTAGASQPLDQLRQVLVGATGGRSGSPR